MLGQLFGKSRNQRIAEALYASAVGQARMPVFYGETRVPDTVDGRFDMIVLHVFLVLHRLKAGEGNAADVGQALFDTMFADMDRCLRELGAGDLGVGRRVKTMAKAFYGRVAAYERGLSAGNGPLADALLRNIFRGDPAKGAVASRIASYMYGQVTALEQHPLDEILDGRVVFADAVSIE